MPWSRDDLTRLVELEAHQQGVDPRLAVALAEQESGFNPTIRSGKGAYGIFQLMPGTAKQLQVNIDDPADNIRGGVTYLKQQLDAFGGDPAKAIAAYNAGPGVVQAYKGVPPYKETRGLVSRVLGSLGPASAEAATSQAQPPPAGMTRLQELEAHLARLEGQAAPQDPQATGQPTPPTATSTPEQDAAYRASRGQQAPATAPQTSPATTTPPGASQGPPSAPAPMARFDALPFLSALDPAARAQLRQDFAGLSPDRQAAFFRQHEPPSDLTVTIEKPSTPQASSALAGMIEPATEGGVARVLADRRTGLSVGEHARVGAATGIDIAGTAGGAAVGALTSPVTGIVGPIVGGTLGGGLAQRANVALGLREQETPLVETPYVNLYPSDVIGGGLNALFVGVPAVARAILRRSQAGKAIVAADEATQAAHTQWQADAQAAEQAAKSQQKELYDTAVIKAKASQREYEMLASQRQQKIATHQAEYDEALKAQQAQDAAKVQARQERITQGQQTYQEAVTRQGEALTQARAVGGRYTPETPSWVMYEKFGDAAKDAVVDLTPAKAALAEVRASRGVLPDGTARPLPSAVESIAGTLEKATGDTSITTIRDELRRLGPLTRSQDGNVRGAAKQLYGIYADVLEASPVANDLLRNANATFRKEMALQDVQEWLRPGHGIVRIDQQGRQAINVGTLLTRLEKEIGDNSLFRGAFAPDELQALRQDFGRLAGTPTMPRALPREPAPVIPGTPPAVPREPAPVTLPADVPVKQVAVPTPTPAPAPVTPREALGARPPVLGPRAGEWGAVLATLQALGVPTAAIAAAAAARVGQKQASWLLANALLSDKGRRVMQAAMDGRGTLNPRVYGALISALTPHEKQAYSRETRGQGR